MAVCVLPGCGCTQYDAAGRVMDGRMFHREHSCGRVEIRAPVVPRGTTVLGMRFSRLGVPRGTTVRGMPFSRLSVPRVGNAVLEAECSTGNIQRSVRQTGTTVRTLPAARLHRPERFPEYATPDRWCAGGCARASAGPQWSGIAWKSSRTLPESQYVRAAEACPQ